MAASTKRAWKLGEFAAHEGSVNCLALGHKSGRVIVTGGDDRKVNMWAVGKSTCILSLSGHTTPVEAVRFSGTEDMVIAGSFSGALKIWDLESVKILRTLTGHKSSVRTIDFHPYGDYVASGSLDTNIKLWDVRRKGCIFTYKGHVDRVNCLRFSPDGRWIASAGEDGLIKLWDLSAGKLLSEFKSHTAAVNTVEFHPNEFFLASGSSDRTVKFWDLESMQFVCSSDGDCTAVRSVVFHPDALCLYGGTENQLKVYGWEPARCFDTLSTGWGRVADIAIAQNQLVGASFSQTNVSTFVADVERLQPICGTNVAPVSQSRPATSTSRRSFVADRPESRTSREQNKPKEDAEEPSAEDTIDETSSLADICDPEKYHEVFRPKNQLSHSPPVSMKPFPAPVDDAVPVLTSTPFATPLSSTRPATSIASSAPPWQEQSSNVEPHSEPVATTKSSAQKVKPRTKKTFPKSRQDGTEDSSRLRRSPQMSTGHEDGASSALVQRENCSYVGSGKSRDDFNVDIKVASRRTKTSDSHRTISERDRGIVAGEERLLKDDKPRAHAKDFLPKSSDSATSDEDVASFIHGGHDVLLTVLSSRSRNLQVVKAMWSAGNIKTAIESALNMNDQAVVFDVVNLMLNKSMLWSLDLCVLLIPALSELAASKYDNYVRTGFEALKQILRQFAPIIKGNVTAPPSIGVGVDISREERYNKCMSCYKLLMNVRSNLEQKSQSGLNSEMLNHLKELRLLMSQLD